MDKAIDAQYLNSYHAVKGDIVPQHDLIAAGPVKKSSSQPRSHGARSPSRCQSTKYISSTNRSSTLLPNADPHWTVSTLDNGINILRAANKLLSSVGNWCSINVF